MTKNDKNGPPFSTDGLFLPDARISRLLHRFGPNLHHWIHAPNSYVCHGGKPDWTTETSHPIEPRVLAALYHDPSHLVGLRFGKQTRWAGFDIDAGSRLHPSRDGGRNLDLLMVSAERHGLLSPEIIRSSHGGGLWLLWGFPDAADTFQTATLLRKITLDAGFTLKSGQLEAFPNCKAFRRTTDRRKYSQYRAYRLPMQPGTGACLLNDDLEPVAGDIGTLLDRLDFGARRLDWAEVQRQAALAYVGYLEHLKPRWRKEGKREAWIAEMEAMIARGWDAHHETNALLGKIATLGVVRDGLRRPALTEFILETAIALPGYSEWCRHRHQMDQRAEDWAASAEGYYWHIDDPDAGRSGSYADMVARAGQGSHQDRGAAYRKQRSDDALARLTAVLEALKGTALSTLSELFQAACQKGRELFGQAFSKRTWVKYRDQLAALIEGLLKPEPQAEQGGTACASNSPDDDGAVIAETQAERGGTVSSPIMKVFEWGPAHAAKSALLALAHSRQPCRFAGRCATGLVTAGKLVNKVHAIAGGAVVEILDALHSTWLDDDPPDLLVYVRPIGSDWRSGIAVPLKFLHPLLE